MHLRRVRWKPPVRERLRAIFIAVRRAFGFRPRDWERIAGERRNALEQLFGKSEECRDTEDVLVFREHIVGATLYVTASLTGKDSGEALNAHWQQYELAVCVRDDKSWPPCTIAEFAEYARSTPLNPGDTIDAAPCVPFWCSIQAFLFAGYGTFRLDGRTCGVLLCIGITPRESQIAFESGSTTLLEELRGAGVFPFTDLTRATVGGGAA